VALHVRPRLYLPGVAAEVVDERSVSKAGGLAEENPDRRPVSDRFGIELVRRRFRCP
jgi:hypothetical protein